MAVTTEHVLGWLRAYAAVIEQQREYLVALDAAIGDADHGENLHRGWSAVLDKLEEARPDTPSAALKVVASTLISTVGGAAGPLYGTAFLRAATAWSETAEPTAHDVAAAIAAGRDGIVARGKAELEDKTMVDVWTPAAEAAEQAAADGGDVRAVLVAASAAADLSAEATIPRVARKGRASYLGDRSSGHKDPGAASSAMLFRAAADVASGK